MRQKRVLVVYPSLVAVYSVFALAAKNSAQVWPSDLLVPLLLSLAVAVTSWAIARIAARDACLAGVLSLVVVMWFAWYGYFEGFLAHRLGLEWVGVPTYGLPLLLVSVVGLSYVLARQYAHVLLAATRYFNITAAVLVAMPVFVLLQGWTKPQPQVLQMEERGRTSPGRVVANAAAQDRPNIYVIILDKYTGARSLRANFGFDNQPFLDSLKTRGFLIPRTPRSNYIQTHLALAAMLNWHLLDDRPVHLKSWDGALATDVEAIEDNRTWRYLRGLGYRFVFLPSAYPGTRRNRFADLQLPRPNKVVDEFGQVWFRNTALLPAAVLWCRRVGCHSNNFPYAPAPAALIDWKFEQLATLPDSSGPLFVFAHLLVPHEPYVYNADCSHRDPLWPRTATEADGPAARVAYIQQIQCVNSKLLRLTSELLARSKKPPIIILQADHGNGRLGVAIGSMEDAGREHVNERTDPFAAYYLPGGAEDVIYDSITPVNVLPRVFNHYFNAGIPPQPDSTFWSTWQEPFDFVPVH
jgi:hypothetical protein